MITNYYDGKDIDDVVNNNEEDVKWWRSQRILMLTKSRWWRGAGDDLGGAKMTAIELCDEWKVNGKKTIVRATRMLMAWQWRTQRYPRIVSTTLKWTYQAMQQSVCMTPKKMTWKQQMTFIYSIIPEIQTSNLQVNFKANLISNMRMPSNRQEPHQFY